MKAAGAQPAQLSDKVDTLPGHVSISTMHLAKGLEFRAVVVMACDDEVLPVQGRIETVSDDSLQHGTSLALRRVHESA